VSHVSGLPSTDRRSLQAGVTYYYKVPRSTAQQASEYRTRSSGAPRRSGLHAALMTCLSFTVTCHWRAGASSRTERLLGESRDRAPPYDRARHFITIDPTFPYSRHRCLQPTPVTFGRRTRSRNTPDHRHEYYYAIWSLLGDDENPNLKCWPRVLLDGLSRSSFSRSQMQGPCGRRRARPFSQGRRPSTSHPTVARLPPLSPSGDHVAVDFEMRMHGLRWAILRR